MRSLAARIGLLLEFPSYEESVASITMRNVRPPWSMGKGLYLFTSAGTVSYIGRALGSSLGERLRSQVRSRCDDDWDAILNHRGTRVSIYQFGPADAFWTASPEAFLIEKHRRRIKKRVS